MTSAQQNQKIRVAVVESDPLRLIGYRSLLEGQHEIVVEGGSISQIEGRKDFNLVLLATHAGQNMFDQIAAVKAVSPELRILVSGPPTDDETILRAITAGTKGYIEESAGAKEFAEAIRVVCASSIWAPRRVLASFVDRATTIMRGKSPAVTFTERERGVLKLLVAGRTNKDIASLLNIEERTVKAHVAKLMRKVGVPNRIALSVHAITRSLLD